jgi:hypothetical protein
MAKIGIAAVILALLVLMLSGRARAAAGIRLIGEPTVENRFPDALLFSLEAESEAEIREVRLRYTFLPENTTVSAQPEFDKGARIHATYTLRSRTGASTGRYMPPGKVLRYSWEIADAAGNELKTPEQETVFADTRFPWQTVTDGTITVNYYRGTRRDAEVMAQVANETVQKASAIAGTSFDFPIKIWAYASQRDFQIALAHQSVTHDPNVLGQAHEPDTFIMVVDRLSSPTALDTARHELTHLVTARALRGGPFKDTYPAWLNEGFSVYMQVSPNDVGYVDELEAAIKKDALIPLRLLSAGTRARNVGLFYGQAYAIVKFLIEKYGQDKFAQMIAEYKQNGSEDETFKKVYGLDRDGLYAEWRKSVGLSPQPGGPAPQPQPAGAPADTDTTTLWLALGGTAALVLLAGGAVAGGLLLARRARTGGDA